MALWSIWSRGRTLRQQLDRRDRELEAIRQVAQALATATDEASLATMALHVALQVVGAEAGSILVYDPAPKQLVFRHVEGGGGSLLEGRGIPATEGIAGRVFTSRQADVSQDVSLQEAHLREIGEEVGYTTRNMITVPLSRRAGEPVGVMQVLNKRTGNLDEHDLHLLETLGSQVALSIEQARLYQEAKLAEVARLLGDIGHDLKNMITPVVTGAGILERIIDDLSARAEEGDRTGRPEPYYAPGTHTEAIAILRAAARRVQGRVAETANCVKGISSPLRLAPCEVNRIAKEVLDALGPAADQDGIRLSLQSPEDVLPIEADEDRLYSLLYNLADNAVTAVRRAKRPGEVTIIVTPQAEVVTVEVRDTGCGMDQETLKLLFTTGVRSSSYLGTGLGTKIVKDVVDMHGGKIEVESSYGVGTTFRVALPVSQKKA